MKKIYLFLLTLAGFFSATAQLTQANHAPSTGDTYVMYRCDSTTTSPGAAGANAMWDFSAITTYSNLVRNYVVQAVTTTTYPAANVALASATNDISYLASSAAALEYYGGNISVGPIAGAVIYSSPAVFASYPMSLNTTSSAAIAGSINVTSPLTTSGTFSGSSSVLTDGSGTISLPGSATFSNALRVVTSQTLDVVTGIASVTVTQVNYDYYVTGIKAPVFSISTSTAVIGGFLGSTTSQTTVARNKDAVPSNTTTVGIRENQNTDYQVAVFPNPATNLVNVSTNNPEAHYLSVFDMTGKLVDKVVMNAGAVKLDVSSYNNGLYLYVISASDNRSIKSGKMTVSH